MTLESYTQGRLVAMHPESTAYDAIRALEDNHIGAVVVQDEGRVVGVVTDRDLALQVISFEQDPLQVRLRTIMAKPVQVVQLQASPRDAARLMLERHVRRLPIVDGSKLVGMVTLDDLIADRAVDLETLAAIIRAQLAEPARLKQAGQRRPGAADHPSDVFRWRREAPRRDHRRDEPPRDFASHLRRDVARAFRRITGG